ncbi:MAG: thiol-disulfide isomerase [Acidobacteria bacterium]|nr:thiol-disulfide isomerase [Acidobacteriota bacterium]
MRFVLLLIPAVVPAATYHGDVKRILDARCVGCHRAGEIAPMKFTTYGEVKPWSKAIRQAVIRKSMPPWHADPARSIPFHNDRSLTAREIAAITEWVDGGALEGKSDASTGVVVVASTATAKPDFVARIPGIEVPAKGTIEYTFLVTPTNFDRDMWISSAEWRIDQRSVVHHINAFIRPKGSSYVRDAPPGKPFVASVQSRRAKREDEREVDRRELLLGFEPGYRPMPWGEGRAKLLPRGADIVFEIHYTANGKAVIDNSELALFFAKQPPKERVFTISPADATFAIPAGANLHSSLTGAVTRREVTLLSMQPHMHLRGKTYSIAVRYPDGLVESLIDVPRYDFRWQTTYFLREPKRLPKNTELQCLAQFDNSPNNPANPNPKQIVRWGDQSWEEMNICFMEVTFPASDDPDVVTLLGTTRPGSATR